MLDSKVKAIKARIKKLETEIAKLEGKLKITPGKSVSKRKSVKKAPERNASTAKTE
jgi:predicted nuclease with TOPRIM domain